MWDRGKLELSLKYMRKDPRKVEQMASRVGSPHLLMI